MHTWNLKNNNPILLYQIVLFGWRNIIGKFCYCSSRFDGPLPVVFMCVCVCFFGCNLHIAAITVTICCFSSKSEGNGPFFLTFCLSPAFRCFTIRAKKFSSLFSIIHRRTDSVIKMLAFKCSTANKKKRYSFILMVIRWVLKPLTVLFIREYFKWKSRTSQTIVVDLLSFVCRCSLLQYRYSECVRCTMYI